MSSEDSSESERRVALEPVGGALAQRRARLTDPQDRLRQVAGRGGAGHEAVLALVDQLHRGVVRAGHDHARRARGGGLHHHHPVALAPGRQDHAQRPAQSPRHLVRGHEAVHAHGVARGPARLTRRSTSARSGPSPKISRRRSGARSRNVGIASTSAGTRFSGMCRPANTSAGSAASGRGRSSGRRTRRAAARAPRAAPRPLSRAAWRREKQNARWGTRAQSSCTA